jgi:hypothetical protein
MMPALRVHCVPFLGLFFAVVVIISHVFTMLFAHLKRSRRFSAY